MYDNEEREFADVHKYLTEGIYRTGIDSPCMPPVVNKCNSLTC